MKNKFVEIIDIFFLFFSNSQSETRKLISSPVKKGAPFLPSASTVRRLPSVVESPRNEETVNKLNHLNSHVPMITDSCLKRKLTKEEEDLNIQNCDNNEIDDIDTNETNDAIENVFSPNNLNAKELKIIENLKEGELFEDPNFPAVSKSLFYRYQLSIS